MIFFIAFVTENLSILKFDVFIIQWFAAVLGVYVVGFQSSLSLEATAVAVFCLRFLTVMVVAMEVSVF